MTWLRLPASVTPWLGAARGQRSYSTDAPAGGCPAAAPAGSPGREQNGVSLAATISAFQLHKVGGEKKEQVLVRIVGTPVHCR